MYISTNVYITVQERDVFFLSGNLGTQYLSGGSCKKERKEGRKKTDNQSVKLLQSAGFSDKLRSGFENL